MDDLRVDSIFPTVTIMIRFWVLLDSVLRSSRKACSCWHLSRRRLTFSLTALLTGSLLEAVGCEFVFMFSLTLVAADAMTFVA